MLLCLLGYSLETRCKVIAFSGHAATHSPHP